MKKTLLSSVIALSLTLPVIGYAQTQTPPPDGGPGWQQGGKPPRGDFMRDLNLTQQQREQIRNIMEKQRIETDRQIRAILTPEQQKKFDQQKADRETRKQQRQDNRQQKQRSAPKQ